MEHSKQHYYLVFFENICLTKNGNEFQDFFSDLMAICHPGDFIRIRPWGKYGDRKNDGFLISEGALFQVYAPKELESHKAAQKISEDFNGAIKEWECKKWIFVHNDKDGLGPEGGRQILELRNLYTQIEFQVWEPITLQRKILDLEEKDIIFLLKVPLPTSSDMMQVGYEDLKVVIETVQYKIPPTNQEIKPVPSDKIEINLLSDEVVMRLNLGAQRSALVAEFFGKWPDPELGDKIAEAFRQEYARLKSEKHSPDDIFWRLLTFAGGAHRGPSIRHESAVLAVLFYFFEKCDIFEPVPITKK